MGIIRKTASIATLGLVNWRSNKEKLELETLARKHVQAELDDTNADLARSKGEAKRAFKRAERARKKAYKAELEQIKLAKKNRRRSRLGRRRRDLAELGGEAKGSARTLGWMARRKARSASNAIVDSAESAADLVRR